MKLQAQIIETAKKFHTSGLSIGCSGNVSIRTDNGFFITPTGMSYDQLCTEDIVECDLAGQVINGRLKPSSEWRFHSAIYQARKEINAIVHVHSSYATALACIRESIPAFHYMIARAGGDNIRCAEYATFGSEALSQNAVIALEDRYACLLANHGQIALGHDVVTALAMAEEVEELARQYCLAKQFGKPVLLDAQEMRVNLEKFKSYGKQKGD